MKVVVYKDGFGELRSFLEAPNAEYSNGMTLIGYEERNIEPVKKTVKKEVGIGNVTIFLSNPLESIPANATNIRILYDIEE